jgi:hypothetical protein
MRRFLAGFGLMIFAGAIAVGAAERVTYVMNDGQRTSGTIASHGADGESRYGSFLTLIRDGGGEERVQLGDVAVIDFGNGAPPDQELQSLPSNSTNVLVLKNGTSQRGTFIDLYRGDTVKFRTDSGQVQDYSVRDVSRIYINPPNARAAWNASARSSVQGTSGTTLESGAVRVDANVPWNQTGVVVRRGDRVAFRATGQVKFGQGPSQAAGPDGADLKNPAYPVPAMPVGGLVGKVGNSAAFPIGSNTQPITMPANGTLVLGVNDNEAGDNSGFFSVVVSKQ